MALTVRRGPKTEAEEESDPWVVWGHGVKAAGNAARLDGWIIRYYINIWNQINKEAFS